MKRTILAATAMALTLLFTLTIAPRAAAQFGLTMHGQVRNLEGKPWPDLTIEIKAENGQSWKTKTDKNGNYSQLNLPPGKYTIVVVSEEQNIHFSTKFDLKSDPDIPADINFKEIAARQGVNAEAIKKQREESEQSQKQFTGMKAHFDAGVTAMNEAGGLRAQWQSAPADQRGPIQEKLTGLYQTATTEFQQAQQAAKEKDPNLPTVVANLGAAYEASGQYQENLSKSHLVAGQRDQATESSKKAEAEYEQAVATFQKAVELKPTQANYFSALGTNLARIGKMDEAGAACDKAAALDPPNAGVCWRNIGIVLRNANKMKEATAPLEKATQIDPKNPDGWYLLATSLLASIETKQQGDKLIYNVPPGTAEAYQKCVDLAPNGPHAQECKDGLASLEMLGQGVETRISTRKKK